MSLDNLMTYGWLGLAVVAWLGLSIGSFLNVVIYRLPIMMERDWLRQAQEILREANSDQPAIEPDPSDDEQQATFNLMLPRSRCPNCEHLITAWQNVPLLSWIFLRGKCASCKTPISARYPVVELLTALATLSVIVCFGFTSLGLGACLLTWLLIAAFGIDFDTKLLPDQLTYPILWLGLLTNTIISGPVPLHDAVIGAIAGYLFLWGTYWAFKLVTGKEGMGYGDFKLFAGLGAWLGWQALPSIILIAAVFGLIYAGTQIVGKKQTSAEPIAFGPFLAFAGWVTLLFRDTVLALFAF